MDDHSLQSGDTQNVDGHIGPETDKVELQDSHKVMYDPFSPEALEKLRLSPIDAEDQDVEMVHTSIAVRKPSKNEFVRAKAGEENRFLAACYVDDVNSETYIVEPKMRRYFGDLAKPFTLVVAMSRNSAVPFLWRLAVPSQNGMGSRWHHSALECAKIAEKKWVRITSDRAAGCYVPLVAQNNLEDPDWSKVPPLSELIRLAFSERIISSPDHPIIKQLQGEI